MEVWTITRLGVGLCMPTMVDEPEDVEAEEKLTKACEHWSRDGKL